MMKCSVSFGVIVLIKFSFYGYSCEQTKRSKLRAKCCD